MGKKTVDETRKGRQKYSSSGPDIRSVGTALSSWPNWKGLEHFDASIPILHQVVFQNHLKWMALNTLKEFQELS